jgi:hypothetical protein
MSRIEVELSEVVHAAISEFVETHGGSVEEFVARAAYWWLMSALEEVGYLQMRSARGSREAFERVLAQVPHAPPDPGDEL